MRTVVGALAVVAMSVFGLTGCGGGGSTEEFCALDADVDLADIDDFDELRSALDDGVDAAPDEIKADVETVRDTFADVSSQLEDEGIDKMSEISPENEEAVAALTSEDFRQASENISTFTEENCDTGS